MKYAFQSLSVMGLIILSACQLGPDSSQISVKNNSPSANQNDEAIKLSSDLPVVDNSVAVSQPAPIAVSGEIPSDSPIDAPAIIESAPVIEPSQAEPPREPASEVLNPAPVPVAPVIVEAPKPRGAFSGEIELQGPYNDVSAPWVESVYRHQCQSGSYFAGVDMVNLKQNRAINGQMINECQLKGGQLHSSLLYIPFQQIDSNLRARGGLAYFMSTLDPSKIQVGKYGNPLATDDGFIDDSTHLIHFEKWNNYRRPEFHGEAICCIDNSLSPPVKTSVDTTIPYSGVEFCWGDGFGTFGCNTHYYSHYPDLINP